MLCEMPMNGKGGKRWQKNGECFQRRKCQTQAAEEKPPESAGKKKQRFPAFFGAGMLCLQEAWAKRAG